MSSDDALYDDDAQAADGSPNAGEGGGEGGAARAGVGVRDWMSGRRGWLAIAALAVVQAVFAVIIIIFRSGATPVPVARMQIIRDLAVETLGHEVSVKQVYQLIRVPGGKQMTIGLDISLILGQLPEERIDGAPRPTPEEFEVFIGAVRELEPGVRSAVNSMLQRIPFRDYGTTDVYAIIKERIRNYVNDNLDRLDFGESVRPGIGKRRVTEVLLPMFVRQMYK